jgi:hypothetical protein
LLLILSNLILFTGYTPQEIPPYETKFLTLTLSFVYEYRVGLDVRGIVVPFPACGKELSPSQKRPDRILGQYRFIFNGYWGNFTGVKATRV